MRKIKEHNINKQLELDANKILRDNKRTLKIAKLKERLKDSFDVNKLKK